MFWSLLTKQSQKYARNVIFSYIIDSNNLANYLNVALQKLFAEWLVFIAHSVEYPSWHGDIFLQVLKLSQFSVNILLQKTNHRSFTSFYQCQTGGHH